MAINTTADRLLAELARKNPNASETELSRIFQKALEALPEDEQEDVLNEVASFYIRNQRDDRH